MGLHGVVADVAFGWEACERLTSALEAAATELEGQAGARRVWSRAARVCWQGRFATDFDVDVARCVADQVEFAEVMRGAAARLRELAALAREEQERRAAARAWQHRQEGESALKQLWDGLTGGDAPPVGPHGPALVAPAAGGRR